MSSRLIRVLPIAPMIRQRENTPRGRSQDMSDNQPMKNLHPEHDLPRQALYPIHLF